jgi:hypothetical protein
MTSGSRPREAGLSALVLAVLLTPPLLGAGLRPPGRFDDYVQRRTGAAIATVPRNVEQLPSGDALRLAWQAFSERYGGRRQKVFVDERTGMPTLVTGPSLRWTGVERASEQTLESLEANARAFLSEHAALLGDGSEWLVLDEAASTRTGEDKWQLVFRQQVDGVRVENARLDFHIARGRLERTFGTSVDLTARTDGVTTATLEDGATPPPDLTYFQVRAINVCNEESP